MEEKTTFKSGFVAVVGRPNVGKSTLINRIIKQKVSIVSDKAQTTRNRILCIHTDEDCQIVFLDTPGIQSRSTSWASSWMKRLTSPSRTSTPCCFSFRATKRRAPVTCSSLTRSRTPAFPVFLIINKVDLMSKEEIFQKITEYNALYPFEQIIPISALNGDNVDAVLDELKKILQEGPKYFPDDMITDQPERLLVAEIVREKLFRCTRDTLR